ncbi:MAG: AI-2E family transporter [Candidatus Liptonbacteria bacterium]|nr:AI-2E family transporter [Candidatus Liptonbacteria bacterium]
MPANRLEHFFFMGLLIASALLLLFLFFPYLDVLVLALTFSILFRPVFKKLLGIARGHGGIAAALVVCLVAAVVIVPLSYFAFQIFWEAQGLYSRLSSGSVGPTTDFIRGQLEKTLPFNIDFNQYAKEALDLVIDNLGIIFSKIADVAITFFLALFVLFYLLRDGDRLWDAILKIGVLSRKNTEEVLARLSFMADSAIRGTLMVAVVQGFLVGFGFFIFGLPNPILWGAIAVIAALVPVFGTALIVIPAVVDLAFIGNMWGAVGFMIWGFFIVGLVDNFLRPLLMRRGTKIHTFLVLMSVVGGISVFGPMGFILGPLILSLFLALLEIYPVVMANRGSTVK